MPARYRRSQEERSLDLINARFYIFERCAFIAGRMPALHKEPENLPKIVLLLPGISVKLNFTLTGVDEKAVRLIDFDQKP